MDVGLAFGGCGKALRDSVLRSPDGESRLPGLGDLFFMLSGIGGTGRARRPVAGGVIERSVVTGDDEPVKAVSKGVMGMPAGGGGN